MKIIKTLLICLIPITLVNCSMFRKYDYEKIKGSGNMRHGMIPIKHTYKSNSQIFESLDPKSIKRGGVIYKQNCYICHGVKADGHGPESFSLKIKPRNLVEAAKSVPNFKFYMKISQWQGTMPGWKSVLTDQDVEDVKSYILYLANK